MLVERVLTQTEHNSSALRVHVGLYTFKFKLKDTNIQPCISKYIRGLLGQ